MFALRERRLHVTQDDFEMAVAKASLELIRSERFLLLRCRRRLATSGCVRGGFSGDEEGRREKHVSSEALEVNAASLSLASSVGGSPCQVCFPSLEERLRNQSLSDGDSRRGSAPRQPDLHWASTVCVARTPEAKACRRKLPS